MNDAAGGTVAMHFDSGSKSTALESFQTLPKFRREAGRWGFEIDILQALSVVDARPL